MALRFADQLREWREAAGLRQDDLAEALKVKQQTVSDWERGRAQPQVARVAQLAELLRVTPDDVLRAMTDGAPSAPAEEPAFLGKVQRLSERDRRVIERMVDEMLGEG